MQGSSAISRLPQYLTAQMVRFFYKVDTQQKAKILRKVSAATASCLEHQQLVCLDGWMSRPGKSVFLPRQSAMKRWDLHRWLGISWSAFAGGLPSGAGPV